MLQGCDRTTIDLDLNVSLDTPNLQKAISVLHDLGMIPRIPEPMSALLSPEKRASWVREKNAIVYTVLSPDGKVQVDLFLNYPIPFSDLRAASDAIEMGGASYRVSSVKHLLEAKRRIDPPRDKDLLDIRMLEELDRHG